MVEFSVIESIIIFCFYSHSHRDRDKNISCMCCRCTKKKCFAVEIRLGEKLSKNLFKLNNKLFVDIFYTYRSYTNKLISI